MEGTKSFVLNRVSMMGLSGLQWKILNRQLDMQVQSLGARSGPGIYTGKSSAQRRTMKLLIW